MWVCPPLVQVRVFVAIQCSRSDGAAVRTRLRRLAVFSDILAAAEHFDFRQREDAFVARKFDANEASWFAGDEWSGSGFLASLFVGAFLLGASLLPSLFSDFAFGSFVLIVGWDRAFEPSIHLGLDAPSIGAVAESVWLERTHEGDVRIGLDRIFHAQAPRSSR